LAISPPSDIVLDVARAVEPAGLEAARTALAQRTGAAAPAGVDAAFSLAEASGTARRGEPVAQADAFKRFEAVVLKTFIQTMLPKDAEQVYGKGLAGDMWKSLMAEKMADAVTERGGIGIASRLLADHYVENEKRLPLGPVSHGPEQSESDRQSALSTALVHDLQRKAAQSLTGSRDDAPGSSQS
jgi:Rod binding domain-containing protein